MSLYNTLKKKYAAEINSQAKYLNPLLRVVLPVNDLDARLADLENKVKDQEQVLNEANDYNEELKKKGHGPGYELSGKEVEAIRLASSVSITIPRLVKEPRKATLSLEAELKAVKDQKSHVEAERRKMGWNMNYRGIKLYQKTRHLDNASLVSLCLLACETQFYEFDETLAKESAHLLYNSLQRNIINLEMDFLHLKQEDYKLLHEKILSDYKPTTDPKTKEVLPFLEPTETAIHYLVENEFYFGKMNFATKLKKEMSALDNDSLIALSAFACNIQQHAFDQRVHAEANHLLRYLDLRSLAKWDGELPLKTRGDYKFVKEQLQRRYNSLVQDANHLYIAGAGEFVQAQQKYFPKLYAYFVASVEGEKSSKSS